MLEIYLAAIDIGLPGGNIIQNPSRGPTGYIDNLGDAVTQLLHWIFPLVGIIAFLLLLYGAFKYLTSGGDEKAVAAAKSTLTTAIIGLIIVFIAYWVVKIFEGALSIQIFLAPEPAYADDTVDIPSSFAGGSFISLTLGSLVTKFLPAVFGIAGIAAFLFFLFGAVKYTTSGGDEKAKASAKHRMTTAFVGLLLVFLAYWIIQVFKAITGVTFF